MDHFIVIRFSSIRNLRGWCLFEVSLFHISLFSLLNDLKRKDIALTSWCGWQAKVRMQKDTTVRLEYQRDKLKLELEGERDRLRFVAPEEEEGEEKLRRRRRRNISTTTNLNCYQRTELLT